MKEVQRFLRLTSRSRMILLELGMPEVRIWLKYIEVVEIPNSPKFRVAIL